MCLFSFYVENCLFSETPVKQNSLKLGITQFQDERLLQHKPETSQIQTFYLEPLVSG